MTENIPLRTRILSKNDTQRIHQAAMQTLGETGMAVHDDDTRKRLIQAGCKESEDGHVLFDESLIERTLVTVPSRMVLYQRNGTAAIDTGDTVTRYSPGLNCIDILDYKTGEHRPCLLEDIIKIARLCEQLPNIDMVASMGNPTDIPPEDQAMATVRAMVEHSDKPLAFIAHDEVEAETIWNFIADVAGGWTALTDKPLAMDLTGPTSPLEIGREACRRLRLSARKSVPTVCYPALMPGINGPMTLAGALAQSGAEILAGVVIHQMEQPGAPVISGSAILPFDMRTVNIAYGGPEYILACLAAADYFSDIGLPSWVGAGCSDAHIVDSQAAAEAGANMTAGALSATSFIHNLGFLSSGKTGSLEMLVLCDELAGMTKRIASGITVNEDTLAVEITRSASKTGKFLTEKRHTARHTRTEMWVPSFFQRTAANDWQETGAKTMSQRMNEKLMDLLG